MRTAAEAVPYHEHIIEHDRFDGCSNQTINQLDTCHASRIVDGGVDSQA